MNYNTQWEEELDLALEEQKALDNQIIVWNDDVNTFDWVIHCLMELCHHTEEQAEQCAYIIHFNGKYAVKKGSLEILKPICVALQDRGLNATLV